ncbi:MAG: CHC2 zinc finger domain-containing protein, partial [Cyanobacteriota bacterium]
MLQRRQSHHRLQTTKAHHHLRCSHDCLDWCHWSPRAFPGGITQPCLNSCSHFRQPGLTYGTAHRSRSASRPGPEQAWPSIPEPPNRSALGTRAHAAEPASRSAPASRPVLPSARRSVSGAKSPVSEPSGHAAPGASPSIPERRSRTAPGSRRHAPEPASSSTPGPRATANTTQTHHHRTTSPPQPTLSFPPAFLDILRDRARITDLFPQADLKRQGSEFLTLCPWHADTNASLTISPRTNRVHCFVCNRGADAIGWLQDSQGLTYSEAVQELAHRYHLPLPEQDPQAAAQAEAHQRECQRLLAWRERQQQQFHQALLADLQQLGPASDALRQRGLSDDTAKTWGLGLNGSRLMLPLRDVQGRTRAFSGRSLTGEDPKYLNSANDALFRKQ